MPGHKLARRTGISSLHYCRLTPRIHSPTITGLYQRSHLPSTTKPASRPQPSFKHLQRQFNRSFKFPQLVLLHHPPRTGLFSLPPSICHQHNFLKPQLHPQPSENYSKNSTVCFTDDLKHQNSSSVAYSISNHIYFQRQCNWVSLHTKCLRHIVTSS